MPVVSTSSPPLSRSAGSGISMTCAQRSARSSRSPAATTSGRPRRTTGSSRTSASVSIRTVTHCRPRRAGLSIATAFTRREGPPVRNGASGGERTHGHPRERDQRQLRPRPARRLEAGTVSHNEHLAIGSEMPHGGVKGSGFGKDMSMYALEEYTAIKHVVFELTGAPRKDWYDAVSTPEPT